MSLPALALEIAAAVLRPARTPHAPEPVPEPPVPPVPAQARRRPGATELDLIEREYPRWTVWAMPTVLNPETIDYVASYAGHSVRASSPEDLCREIDAAEAEPPPSLVRLYMTCDP